MFRSKHCFYLYFYLFIGLVVCKSCPPAPTINPCECKLEPFAGGESVVTVRCVELHPFGVLQNVLSNLDGYEIDKLDITNTDISTLGFGAFERIKPKQLYFRGAPIFDFSRNGKALFAGLEESLEILLISNSNLTSEAQLEYLNGLSNLRTLDLSQNALTRVKQIWYKEQKQLQLLHLNKNKITVIDAFAFANLNNIVMIDLSENSIGTLHRSMFAKPSKYISVLRLSYNNIDYLSSNVFTEMPSLRKVYIDYNRLKSLAADAWMPLWKKKLSLDVSGNQIRCDCSIMWITELLVPDRLEGTCSWPVSLQGLSLAELTPWNIAEAPEMKNEVCVSALKPQT